MTGLAAATPPRRAFCLLGVAPATPPRRGFCLTGAAPATPPRRGLIARGLITFSWRGDGPGRTHARDAGSPMRYRPGWWRCSRGRAFPAPPSGLPKTAIRVWRTNGEAHGGERAGPVHGHGPTGQDAFAP